MRANLYAHHNKTDFALKPDELLYCPVFGSCLPATRNSLVGYADTADAHALHMESLLAWRHDCDIPTLFYVRFDWSEFG